jgi:hypothetical protein
LPSAFLIILPIHPRQTSWTGFSWQFFINKIIQENAAMRLALEDISVIGIDYDGYETVEGLKKCIDRICETAQKAYPETIVDWEGKEVCALCLRKFDNEVQNKE